MQSLVFFGKGGIGKSTTSSNVSAAFASSGKRVLHVGCDPKHDSTVSLLQGRMLEPLMERVTTTRGVTAEQIVTRSSLGIDCVEAGGPSAGVGCGGRGVSRMFEIFHEAKLLDSDRYDVAVYDVLGDVVCGGFAAPLRKGVGEKVAIVTSEEVMSLYAANNIARAIVHYAENGVALAGLVVNMRDGNDPSLVARFAARIGTRILAVIPRDTLVREAEFRRTNVVSFAPRSAMAGLYRSLAETLLELRTSELPLPTPLDEREFYHQVETRFQTSGRKEVSLEERVQRADAGVIPVQHLVRRAAKHNDDKMVYDVELAAGRRAVRLGRVQANEALQRLRSAFPAETQTLRMEDLVS